MKAINETRSDSDSSQLIEPTSVSHTNYTYKKKLGSGTSQFGANLKAIWDLMLPVFLEKVPQSLVSICVAMIQFHGLINYHHWENIVWGILVAESQRKDSPIQHCIVEGKDCFKVDVNIKDWQSSNPNHHPYYYNRAQQKVIEMRSHNTETPSDKHVPVPHNDGTILYDPFAGIDPQSSVIPWEMNPETAQSLMYDILGMRDPEYRDFAMKALLRLSDKESEIYAGELWKMALLYEKIIEIVFELFCELADKNDTWAKIVLETICCFHKTKVRKIPTDDIIEAGLIIPPQLGEIKADGLLFLLNYMNDKPIQWKKVINWLLRSHTSRFRKFFVTSLKLLWLHNRHLEDVIQPIFKRLLRSESWQTSILYQPF